MKSLPRLILSLAGCALLATPALRADEPTVPPADKPDRQERRHERREDLRENLQKMAKELDLTADQQAKIEAIHKQTFEARKAVQDDTTLSDEQKKEKMMALRKSTEEQVHALLTPAQQAKAKALREKRGRHGDQPPGEKPPGN